MTERTSPMRTLQDLQTLLDTVRADDQLAADLAAEQERQARLQAQRDAVASDLTHAQAALMDAEAAAEQAYLLGEPVDETPLAQARQQVLALEARQRWLRRGLDEAAGRVQALHDARVSRVEP